jgi:hypothetical protein
MSSVRRVSFGCIRNSFLEDNRSGAAMKTLFVDPVLSG